MSKLIAIIAPMLMGKRYEADFRIVLNNYDQELNLQFLYKFISDNYVIKNKKSQFSYKDDTIPAAGYFLSSKLRKAGYDTALTPFFDDSTLEKIAQKNPLAVCLSTTMITRKSSCINVIRHIKKKIPDVKIIIGGTLTWKSFLIYTKSDHNRIDDKETVDIDEEDWRLFSSFNENYNDCLFITAPHGLSILYRVLREIENGRNTDFTDIPNLIIPLKNKFHFTRFQEDSFELDEEFTNWELLDKLPSRIPIRTSIGCSFRCTFCDFCTLYPTLLIRDVNSIKKELTIIRTIIESRHQPAVLHFTDDNIFYSKERLKDICTTIINSKVEVPWISFMRASSVNNSNIALLKNSNMLYSMMGIESGDPDILKAMNKKQDLKEIKTVIELLDNNRISTLLYFIVGFPGENETTLENTQAFINSLNLKNLFITYQLYPLKISDLSLLSNEENIKRWNISKTAQTWKHYTMDSTQAKKETLNLFKRINTIPYHYPEENNFFNFRFSFNDRKKLLNLRKDLTLAIHEKADLHTIQDLFTAIAITMNLPANPPNLTTIGQLTVPGC